MTKLKPSETKMNTKTLEEQIHLCSYFGRNDDLINSF